MLYKSDTGSTATVRTAGLNQSINAAKISGNGTRILFRSDSDPTGSDTSNELYLWTEPSTFTKITSTNSATAPDTSFSINYEGNLVAFSTQENTGAFAGKNPDGNFEMYICDNAGSSLTMITSNTSGGTGTKEPSITGSSSLGLIKAAFSSDRNLTGNNADGSTEIFLWSLSGTISSTNSSYTQITSTPAGKTCGLPQISKDGKFVAFYSNADITGGNSDGNYEIFVWNSNGTTVQVTSTASGNNYNPVIGSYTGLYETADVQYGPRIAYYYNNGSYDNIFLATSTIPVPASSRVGLVILVLLLATLAIFSLRRRMKTA
jgi:hypothetical protein